jgi:hypothetical protein
MYDFLFQRGRLNSGVQSGLCRREHSIRCRDPGFSPSVKQLPFTFEIDFVKWHHENGTRKLELKESIPRVGTVPELMPVPSYLVNVGVTHHRVSTIDAPQLHTFSILSKAKQKYC